MFLLLVIKCLPFLPFNFWSSFFACTIYLNAELQCILFLAILWLCLEMMGNTVVACEYINGFAWRACSNDIISLRKTNWCTSGIVISSKCNHKSRNHLQARVVPKTKHWVLLAIEVFMRIMQKLTYRWLLLRGSYNWVEYVTSRNYVTEQDW